MLIADDHPIVVDGLVALLKDKFDVVGTVSDGTRLLDDAIRLRPDIVVTDISMPGLGRAGGAPAPEGEAERYSRDRADHARGGGVGD